MGKGLDQLEDLKDDSIRLAKLKWASLRLTAAENISTLLSKAFGFIIFLVLMFIAAMFLMVGLALWLGELMGHLSLGFLVAGGVFVIVGLVIYFIREKLVVNSLVRTFVDLFFSSKLWDNGTPE